jgi:hypothetical protein
MKQKIINHIRAGYSGLYLVSAEEQRVEAEMGAVAGELKSQLCFWSAADGLVNVTQGTTSASGDPLEALLAIQEMQGQTVILLKDFHLFLQDPNPVLIRKLKDVLLQARTASKTLIILGCRLCLPPELEREFTVVEIPLPGREQFTPVLDGIIESARLGALQEEQREEILGAASGLTTMEAENAFALSVVESGSIEPGIIAREKAQALKKGGLLEIVEGGRSLDSIGGLDQLKDWLLKRRNAFGRRAMNYGLPSPRGLLIIGLPGTGKSLSAKATAQVFGIPLLRLDAGRIFAGLVGQSEANIRTVIQTAEAIAPCCVWVDELEKGFSGTRSSNATDGGTSSRVFGTFLSWMQEKKAAVFVVATANDVTQLPPELLRKGRFDELFFVDLPNQEERELIWEIQIGNYGRKPDEFDLVQLARMTEGLTGSEIENVFVDALHMAFAASEREPTDLDVAQALNGFVPLSKLMAEQITGLRNWAKGRARSATSQAPERRTRKLAV